MGSLTLYLGAHIEDKLRKIMEATGYTRYTAARLSIIITYLLLEEKPEYFRQLASRASRML